MSRINTSCGQSLESESAPRVGDSPRDFALNPSSHPRGLFRLSWDGVRYLLLALYVMLCLYPFLWMLSASLRTSAGGFSAGLSLWVDDPQWVNYQEIWQAANVPRAAFVT